VRCRDVQMPSNLSALVPDDRAQQPCRYVRHPGREDFVKSVTVPAGQVEEAADPSQVFHERTDRRALVSADDEISLPMPGLRAVLEREGASRRCRRTTGIPASQPPSPGRRPAASPS
jgi:hypothetical protein